MRYLLLVLDAVTGKWYVAEQTDMPEDILAKGRQLIDENPMLVYRVFDVDKDSV